MRLFALGLAAVVSLAGCSTIGRWFGSGGTPVKPAELTEFKPSATLVREWDVQVGASGPYTFSPAKDGQFIYAAGQDGQVVKIDLPSGRVMWRAEAGKPLSAGVGVGDGLALVGTPQGEVIALRTSDGQRAWTARLSGEVLSVPVAGHGMVAARGNDGKIYLLDAKDGKQRWVYSRSLPALTLREPSGMFLGESALYAGQPGGKLTALSLVNGAPIWEAVVALPKGTTELERIADVTGPLAVNAQIICAAAYQGRVACFDKATGNLSWAREFSAVRGVDMDSRNIYAADDHDVIQAFDLQRGASVWKQDKLRDRSLSTPMAQGRYVAVGDFQGYIHLLNADDGAFAARVATEGSAIVGQMVPLNAGLVAQTVNGGVYAFKIQGPGIRDQ